MEFWRSRYVTARKKHRCEYCGAPINIGNRYSRETGVANGDFNDYCMCVRCRDVWGDLNDGWDEMLGEFVQDFNDCDLLVCPKCGCHNVAEQDYAGDMMSVKCECDNCHAEYTVDLSAEDIRKLLKEQEERARQRSRL